MSEEGPLRKGGGGKVFPGEFRYCPACGRVGNVELCGPHANVTPLICETRPHPDPAVQATYRWEGFERAVEMARKSEFDLPMDPNRARLIKG